MNGFDACNVTPSSIDAFNKGREIGLQSSHDGDTAAALKALSIYTQGLLKAHEGLRPEDRRSIWRKEARDAIDGLSCADPLHFKESVRSHPNDPPLRAADLDHGKISETSKLVDEAYTILKSPESASPAGNFLPIDYRLARTNDFIRERVDGLGENSRLAFVARFNSQISPQVESEDGLRVVAGLSRDELHVRVEIQSPREACDDFGCR